MHILVCSARTHDDGRRQCDRPDPPQIHIQYDDDLSDQRQIPGDPSGQSCRPQSGDRLKYHIYKRRIHRKRQSRRTDQQDRKPQDDHHDPCPDILLPDLPVEHFRITFPFQVSRHGEDQDRQRGGLDPARCPHRGTAREHQK